MSATLTQLSDVDGPTIDAVKVGSTLAQFISLISVLQDMMSTGNAEVLHMRALAEHSSSVLGMSWNSE